MSTLTPAQHDVLQAWRAGAAFGLLIGGRGWRSESLWDQIVAELEPDAVLATAAGDLAGLADDRDPWTGAMVAGIATRARAHTLVLAHAAGIGEEHAALLASAPRILARADALDEVPAALRAPLTAIIVPPATLATVDELRAQLTPSPATIGARPPRVPLPPHALDRVLALLTTSGLVDHRLDLGAAHLAEHLPALEDRRLRAIEETVCRPRTQATSASPKPREHEPQDAPETHEQENHQHPSPPDHDTTDGSGASEQPPQPAEPDRAPRRLRRVRSRSRSRSRSRVRRPLPCRVGPIVENARRGRRRRVSALRRGERLDLHATLVAALPMQRARGRGPVGRLRILPEDLRTRRRAHSGGRLVILIVDASGSMARRTIRRAKGIALAHLTAAYRDRAHVAIIVARGPAAYIALAPTRSIRKAGAALRALPTGGGTPLADAAQQAARLAAHHESANAEVILLTDGRANVSSGDDPRLDAEAALHDLTAQGTRLTVEMLGNRSRHDRWLQPFTGRDARGPAGRRGRGA